MKAKLLVAAVLALAVLLAPMSCTPTQQGAWIGGATGATAGAILSHHHRSRGALIGGVAGGIIGAMIGHTYEYYKFCPACGRRFHASKLYCPYDGAPLQMVQ